MVISWYGQTCFRINSSKGKNGQVNILIDPFNKEPGFRSPKIDSDILLLSSGETPKKEIPENVFVINGSGEYDIKEVYINGFNGSGKTTIYVVEAEDIKVCHLGFLNQKELAAEQLDGIGEVDILMISVGGGESIGAKEAIKIMSQIEPKITIPMNYRTDKIKSKLEPIDVFLKALGIKSLAPAPKLSVKKKDLSGEEAKIVVLE